MWLTAFYNWSRPPSSTGLSKVDFYDMESTQHYPAVSTCDVRIWLPRGIADPEMLQQLLEEAITGTDRFGKI